MTRQPVVAGTFYEDEPKHLRMQISSCFSSPLGPKEIKQSQAIGCISPHAGYTYSGPCAAHVYASLPRTDLYIIIGLSHNGYGSCISLEDWETPLGTARADKEFLKELMSVSGLKADESAHAIEHSLEVQLPFIQHLNPAAKIAPVIASPDMDYSALANAIAGTIKKLGKHAIIIASSDFTHYGKHYGYSPFTSDVKENLYKLDNTAIKFIENLDAKGFLKFIDDTGATICGKWPIATVIEACRLLGAQKARLLSYYTSGDLTNDYNTAVGYGGITIEL